MKTITPTKTITFTLDELEAQVLLRKLTTNSVNPIERRSVIEPLIDFLHKEIEGKEPKIRL